MPEFSGLPITMWLSEPEGDRNMELAEDFWFDDRAGRRWLAPAASVIDGASIPRPLWSTVGSPYTGSYRRASIVHDVACNQATTPAERRAADRMFYEACRAGGCSVAEATILYLGVRIGANWNRVPFWEAADREIPPEPKMRRSVADQKVEADFEVAVQEVLALPPSDDPAEVERRVDAVLTQIAGVNLAVP